MLSETSVTDTVRQEARTLYHGKGRSAYRIAREFDLPLDEVLEMVREKPLPRCSRCGDECSRLHMQFCTKRCYDAARAKAKAERLAGRPEGGGCGCSEKRLCKRHAALLAHMRGDRP